LQQYNHARTYLEQTLEQEAEAKIASNRRFLSEVQQKIEAYNQAVSGINNCLQAMHLHDHLLPVIGNSDIVPIFLDAEAFNLTLANVDLPKSDGKVDAVGVEV
jgi:hypothetical protein